jgi:hypothetical protein
MADQVDEFSTLVEDLSNAAPDHEFATISEEILDNPPPDEDDIPF